jgi:hypothetical protein
MAWNLKAQIVESCSCNMLCPCWFLNKDLMKVDQGWCDSAILFRIQEGKSDGVNLAGRSVVVAVDLPGPTMFDGNGTARVCVDDKATPAQVAQLEAIFQGKKGGPMAILGGLMTRWLPTQAVPFKFQEHDGSLVAEVGRFGHVKSDRMKTDKGEPVSLRNAGLVSAMQMESVDLAPSHSDWADPGLPRKFETKSGVVGSFRWSG